ncbi:hypothetical protein DPEC_G00134690 [Dallia pectoralis]|uniref:Uncharacterized protein n=1 Tax=Dallia pectoralis TaxID=75939 RepID=A0ACC2GS22_DALPE|nr:hypothetical protein DPEC_G00134690 [Dallia pectoralis]
MVEHQRRPRSFTTRQDRTKPDQTRGPIRTIQNARQARPRQSQTGPDPGRTDKPPKMHHAQKYGWHQSHKSANSAYRQQLKPRCGTHCRRRSSTQEIKPPARQGTAVQHALLGDVVSLRVTLSCEFLLMDTTVICSEGRWCGAVWPLRDTSTPGVKKSLRGEDKGGMGKEVSPEALKKTGTQGTEMLQPEIQPAVTKVESQHTCMPKCREKRAVDNNMLYQDHILSGFLFQPR